MSPHAFGARAKRWGEMSHTPPVLPSASMGRVIQVGGFQPREHSVAYAPKHDERLALRTLRVHALIAFYLVRLNSNIFVVTAQSGARAYSTFNVLVLASTRKTEPY